MKIKSLIINILRYLVSCLARNLINFHFVNHFEPAMVWRCSVKTVFLEIRKIHNKTSVLESLFYRDIAKVFSCEFCKKFKNTFFCRTPPGAASAFQTSNYNILEGIKIKADIHAI